MYRLKRVSAYLASYIIIYAPFDVQYPTITDSMVSSVPIVIGAAMQSRVISCACCVTVVACCDTVDVGS